MATLEDEPAHLGHLGLHGVDVGLATEPRVDGHHEHEVDEVEDVLHRAGRRGGVDGDRGSGAELADVAQGAVQVAAGLGVDDEHLAPGVDVARRQLVGLLHHEVGLEHDGGVRPARGDDIGPEGEVRHEAPVHHVPLDPVDACLLEGRHLRAQPREVSG